MICVPRERPLDMLPAGHWKLQCQSFVAYGTKDWHCNFAQRLGRLGCRSAFRRIVALVHPGLWSVSRITVTLLISFRQVAEERPKPGKPVAAVHVMLDDIKREVIKPAKTPDRDGEQYGGFERRMLDEKQGRSE